MARLISIANKVLVIQASLKLSSVGITDPLELFLETSLNDAFLKIHEPQLTIRGHYFSCFGHLGALVTKSCLTLVTPWTAAHWAPLSIVFTKQKYWSVLPFPSPRDLPDPGIKPGSPALQGRFFTDWATREVLVTLPELLRRRLMLMALEMASSEEPNNPIWPLSECISSPSAPRSKMAKMVSKHIWPIFPSKGILKQQIYLAPSHN